MEKPARYKAKNKKPASKPKTPKKRKSDGKVILLTLMRHAFLCKLKQVANKL